MLPLNLSDTAATSQDGSSLEFIAAIVGRQCYIQDASGRGLWPVSSRFQIVLALGNKTPSFQQTIIIKTLWHSPPGHKYQY